MLLDSLDTGKKNKQNKMKEEYEYDAFVIYSPVGDDLKFAKCMAEKLEAPPFGLRLFIPWRDCSDDASDHSVTADLIENKCRKCIVVISKNFEKSEVAEFQLKHAHSISPGYRTRKILPIRLDDSDLPPVLKQVTTIDYHATDLRSWFWKRLYSAFRIEERNPQLRRSEDPSLLPDIVLDTSSKSIREFWCGAKKMDP